MNLLQKISILGLGAGLLAGRPICPPLAADRGFGGEKTRWIVQKTSTLTIAGQTNINKFSCSVNEYTEPDTITCLMKSYPNDPQGISLRGSLRINIGDFDCRNRIMTAEFRKTLKSQQYPQLTIGFVSLERMPFSGNATGAIKGCVDVELAGITRRFDISYTASRTNTGIQLIGSRTFGFSDFQLRAPQKMGGLIRVSDQLNVQFILCLLPTD